MTFEELKAVLRQVGEIVLATIVFINRLDLERMMRRQSSRRREVDQEHGPTWITDNRQVDRRREFRRLHMLRGYVRRRWHDLSGSVPSSVKRSAQRTRERIARKK